MTDTPPASPPPVAEPIPSLFERAGGAAGVETLVNRFYDLMDGEPAYAELRAMHQPDLGQTRTSLTEFLTAWLGGPRTWFEKRPGVCIMSMHRSMEMSRETAAQWIHAMSRAMAGSGIEPALGQQMQQAFLRMANGMLAR